MATVTLGNIKFNWKGAWNSATAYVVDDVVSLSGSSYVCIQAGTNQNPSTATAYWEQMSSAGTNGTDLSTTLTTQGDIVYRDGSGLARLAAGTNGQALLTGGAGANPSWGTLSSDYVKLASVDSTSGEVSFDGFFTSDYKVYDVIAHMCISNGTNWAKIFVNSGGSKVTASNYRLVASGASRDSGADATIKYSKWNEAYGIAHYWGGPAKLTARIYDPLDTTREKFIHISANSYQSDTKLWQESIVNVYNTDAAISGVTFGSSGTLDVFQATLYGLKA